MNNTRHIILRLILSIAISCMVIALIFGLLSGRHPDISPSQILDTLKRASLVALGFYFLCQLLQTLFRAIRYGVLLKAGQVKNPPSLYHLYLTTLTRNMLVDMLPARIGELSYVAMLNKGYEVKAGDCFSSLTLSVLFDFVALLMIAAFTLAAPLFSAGTQQLLLVSMGILLVITVVGWVVLFYGPEWFSRRLSNVQFRFSLLNRLMKFLHELAHAFTYVRKSKKLLAIILLSLAVRIIKYTGLYLLFAGVTRNVCPELATASPIIVIIALIAAEGTASLALIPTFMSFGTYEAGGLAALTLLGFPPETSILVMFSMHILSQIIDYSLGGLGLILFTLSVTLPQKVKTMRSRKFLPKLIFATGSLILMCSLLAAGWSWRGLKKLGRMSPPEEGSGTSLSKQEQQAVQKVTDNLNGFIVWSSNRHGNHDILKMTLPGGKITRLTKHPHTESFPRISPDGSKIVLCRTKIAWASQRDPLPWDVIIIDAKSGKELEVIPDGNTPTWSDDGSAVFFQRKAGQFVKHELGSGKETVLFSSGTDPVPANIHLQTPDYNENSKRLAVTFRGRERDTVLLGLDGKRLRVGSSRGCQLAWSPDYEFLYYVDHGGEMKNAVYYLESRTEGGRIWLDLPLPYSHEYFPRLSNDGKYMVLGACAEGHEHDSADYEIFLWPVGAPAENAVRITHHTGNDCWPDIFLGSSQK